MNILNSSESRDYKLVSILDDNKKYKTVYIHRLIELTFIPNDDNSKIHVNHKDGNKYNNHLDNLEWVTRSENLQHAADNGLINFSTRAIELYDTEGNLIDTFDGPRDAERKTGISSKRVSDYCLGKLKPSNKFLWSYIDKDVIDRTVVDMEDLPNETWKRYVDSNYEVSNMGRVRNLSTMYIMKKTTRKDKRESVNIVIGDHHKNFLVHRLVALIFLPNIDNLPEVNHIDKNPLNNKLENLEWISRRDNIRYSQAKKVIQMDSEENIVKIWDSITEAASELIYVKVTYQVVAETQENIPVHLNGNSQINHTFRSINKLSSSVICNKNIKKNCPYAKIECPISAFT